MHAVKPGDRAQPYGRFAFDNALTQARVGMSGLRGLHHAWPVIRPAPLIERPNIGRRLDHCRRASKGRRATVHERVLYENVFDTPSRAGRPERLEPAEQL